MHIQQMLVAMILSALLVFTAGCGADDAPSVTNDVQIAATPGAQATIEFSAPDKPGAQPDCTITDAQLAKVLHVVRVQQTNGSEYTAVIAFDDSADVIDLAGKSYSDAVEITVDGQTATAAVAVTAPEVSGLAIAPGAAVTVPAGSVTAGAFLKALNPGVTFKDGTGSVPYDTLSGALQQDAQNKTVFQQSSSDPALSVTDNGSELAAKKPGTVTVTVNGTPVHVTVQ